MEKIASPADLSAELRVLLAYTTEQGPSRVKLAQHLRELADRVAAHDSAQRLMRNVQESMTQLRIHVAGSHMDRGRANNYQAEDAAQKILDVLIDVDSQLDRAAHLLAQYERMFPVV